ncbi:MAP kinase-activated protein kinase 2 [Toxocara canis]|uniref:non-specific serine/threonine protein kinase n=1 Tax=Toxocara canis TaxID=6265 RepID=A0A0B2V9K6_TOXCA|nr:MAP kinase-activated protein kinase 2 [Toxocara canis]
MNPIFISVGDCSEKKAILRAECAESDIWIAVVSVGESSFSFQKIPCVSAHEDLLDVSVVKSETSVTVQENICVSASSGMIDKHESDEEERTTTLRLCGCSKNSGSTSDGSVTGASILQSKRLKSTSPSFRCYTHSINDDYRISHEVLGVGESGKVRACYNKETNEKYALKVLRDGPKARREVELHYLENICVSASSGMIDKHESDEEERTTTLRLCGCSKNSGSTSDGSVTGASILQSKRLKSTSPSFRCYTHSINDDYRISHEVLGVGESGKVRACYNKETNEKYALKVLRDGPKARREVELHYLVSCHENVLTIVDIYENAFGGVKCLLVIVEFASGGDLLTRFENQGSRPYPERMVGEIIRQVGSAVKYLHDMNIAHRDIKLENILCSSCDGSCVYKLADFGFAKRPERNTLMQSPCCTPFYVAPEILAREQYDKSCDMWALGVVTYILLCGYPPFYSMKGVPLSPGMKTRIASGCYKFPPAEWDHVTESTKNVIKHLLLTDPAARSTIDDLITSAFVKGQTPPRDDLSESPAEDDQEKLEDKPFPIPQSIRFLNGGVNRAHRLHSIQEEVGRAMDMMRLGSDTCFIKHPRLSCNSLLARRRNVISASLADGTQSVSVMGIS